MAAIGSAVGLGNLWRFPFQAGQHGGSAFVIIYLFCVFFVAYPILMGELAIGRNKGLSAVGSTRQIALDAGRPGAWSIVGWMGVFAALAGLTIYLIIAGQVMAYCVMAFAGEFAAQSSSGTSQPVSLYAGSASKVVWHTLFSVITISVVAAGLKNGIERVVTVLMPLFFVLLVGISGYSLANGAASEALNYLFSPDFSAITASAVLAALGQAFFSVGVGIAVMITYGSFLSSGEGIAGNAATIAVSDTLVAIVAGLMIFPIVFAHGLDPAQGSGLIFSALPAVFAGMPGGSLIGGLFFFLALIAALTSSISLLIAISTAGAERFGVRSSISAIVSGAVVWVMGIITILIAGLSDWINFLAGSVFLPLGGLLVAIFAGWVVPRSVIREELSDTSDRLFELWLFFVRYPAIIAIALIFVLGIDAEFDFGLNAFISSLSK